MVYKRPILRTFSSLGLIESTGPVQTQYAEMNVYGGRTASLQDNTPAEYRLAKADTTHGIITVKEVHHA